MPASCCPKKESPESCPYRSLPCSGSPSCLALRRSLHRRRLRRARAPRTRDRGSSSARRARGDRSTWKSVPPWSRPRSRSTRSRVRSGERARQVPERTSPASMRRSPRSAPSPRPGYSCFSWFRRRGARGAGRERRRQAHHGVRRACSPHCPIARVTRAAAPCRPRRRRAEVDPGSLARWIAPAWSRCESASSARCRLRGPCDR